MNLSRSKLVFKIVIAIALFAIPLLWILSQENVAAYIMDFQQYGRANFGEILNM